MSVFAMLRVSALSVSVCLLLEHSAPMTLKAKVQSVRLAEVQKRLDDTLCVCKQSSREAGTEMRWEAMGSGRCSNTSESRLALADGAITLFSIDECGWGQRRADV
jgi:hypothetical protein